MAIRDGIRDSLHQLLDNANAQKLLYEFMEEVFALSEVQRLLNDFSLRAAKPEDL